MSFDGSDRRCISVLAQHQGNNANNDNDDDDDDDDSDNNDNNDNNNNNNNNNNKCQSLCLFKARYITFLLFYYFNEGT